MGKYSAIREMFYGNRGQNDTIQIEDEDVKVLDVITECDDYLRDKLSSTPDLFEKYKKFDDAISELGLIENEHYFAEGFRFGFLMAIDVFDFNKR